MSGVAAVAAQKRWRDNLDAYHEGWFEEPLEKNKNQATSQ